MKKCILFSFVTLLFFSCKSKVDLIVYNAKVYTVDSVFSTAEAIAVKEGKIEAVGSSKDLLEKYEATEKLDAGGKAVYPGFIDAHAHFFRYGLGLQTADLVETESWEANFK